MLYLIGIISLWILLTIITVASIGFFVLIVYGLMLPSETKTLKPYGNGCLKFENGKKYKFNKLFFYQHLGHESFTVNLEWILKCDGQYIDIVDNYNGTCTDEKHWVSPLCCEEVK